MQCLLCGESIGGLNFVVIKVFKNANALEKIFFCHKTCLEELIKDAIEVLEAIEMESEENGKEEG